MPEEIKNEEVKNVEQIVDEKMNEILNDSTIKNEENNKFINDVGSSLKKGEVPIDMIMNKYNEAFSKLDDIKKNHPEFESFVKHYQDKINQGILKMQEMLKNQSNGK